MYTRMREPGNRDLAAPPCAPVLWEITAKFVPIYGLDSIGNVDELEVEIVTTAMGQTAMEAYTAAVPKLQGAAFHQCRFRQVLPHAPTSEPVA